jgi:acyl carrier protein
MGIYDFIIESLKSITGKEDITPEIDLVNDLEMDSLMFVRLIVEVEIKLGISVEDSLLDMSAFTTVNDFCQFITAQRDPAI